MGNPAGVKRKRRMKRHKKNIETRIRAAEKKTTKR
jgi:hypothetical protein